MEIPLVINGKISIHALLAESDLRPDQARKSRNYFNPRSPCGERRYRGHPVQHLSRISIHALLAESDVQTQQLPAGSDKFQSTLSLRRATAWLMSYRSAPLHFNPRSPCGERLVLPPLYLFVGLISIHALLAESDVFVVHFVQIRRDFNPRSPCGERPPRQMMPLSLLNFNPRSPCGERRYRRGQGLVLSLISIHALLAESDPSSVMIQLPASDFNPRSPCGERHLAPST